MSRYRPIPIFLGALLIRWGYDAVVYLMMGMPGLMGVDSDTYLGHAIEFATQLRGGEVSGWQWFGSTAFIMPLYRWLVTLNVLWFGGMATISYVLMQGVMDAATCLLIGMMAGEISPRYRLPAAVAAAINPTQIVLAGILYTDTLFLLLVAASLLGTVRWLLRPTFGAAILIGAGLGGALLTRVLIAPWAFALLAFLLLVPAMQRKLDRRLVSQVVVAFAIFATCIGSLLANNVARFSTWSLTAQTGVYLAQWVVPLVREAHDGTPWQKTYDEMTKKAQDRFGPEPDDLFERSRQYSALGREELARFPPLDIAEAWARGFAINLGSPAIILSPPVLALPHMGFYVTTGGSMIEKVRNFLLYSSSAAYAWILVAGTVGVAAIRLLELVGLVALFRQRTPLAVMAVLGGWCAFVLLVNGPIASPKYRLPMEPVFVLLTAAGWVTLRGRADRQDEAEPTQRSRQA